MYSKLQMAKKYAGYLLRASNGKGHGIHSPFVFDFVTNVLNDKRTFYCYRTIEKLRGYLKRDKTILAIDDFGAGSKVAGHIQRTVSSIARYSLKPKKYSRLLFRMINHYQPSTVLELGTSLGITTAYMASGNAGAQVVTMEGAGAVANIAKQNFSVLCLNNIAVIEGNFDNTLPATLQQLPVVDFVFIDGNHRRQPTLDYFEQLLHKTKEHSLCIFDDIHWSNEMEEAWNLIKAHATVTLSIDLFFIGIVFFRKENKAKQEYTIRF